MKRTATLKEAVSGRNRVSRYRRRTCARALWAALLAVVLIPAAASSQAAHAAREQRVWHWFGGCVATDSLMLDFQVDGKAVYSSVFPICKVRRADIKPEPQQRLLTFRFEAAPRRFGAQG